MHFLRYKVWPIIAGLIIASLVMIGFEFVNGFIFPLPTNLDWSDPAAVASFTQSLPWNAFILVLLGWIAGSFAGGWIAALLSHERNYRVSLALGVLLTIAGIANVMMIGHPLLFVVISLPMFLIFTYVGHRFALSQRQALSESSM